MKPYRPGLSDLLVLVAPLAVFAIALLAAGAITWG